MYKFKDHRSNDRQQEERDQDRTEIGNKECEHTNSSFHTKSGEYQLTFTVLSSFVASVYFLKKSI